MGISNGKPKNLYNCKRFCRRDEFIEEQVERGLLIEEVKSFIKYLDENYNFKNQKK